MQARPPLLDIGHLLISANRVLGARTAGPIRELGLTPQQALVLLAIKEQHDQAITPGQIGTFIAADSPTVSGIISRLERNGYVVTGDNPRDKRSRLVTLTVKAEALVPEVHRIVVDASLWAASLMDADDFERLKELLERFVSLAEASLEAT